jgi:hypothetical protein
MEGVERAERVGNPGCHVRSHLLRLCDEEREELLHLLLLLLLLRGLREPVPFSSFLCVCPEPVLVNVRFLYINGAKKTRSCRLDLVGEPIGYLQAFCCGAGASRCELLQ